MLRRLHGSAIQRLLVVGCGDAASLGEWLTLRPEETVGVDLYRFDKAWRTVTREAAKRGLRVRFIQSDIAHLRQLASGWADAIVSEAVLEHCQSVPAVLQECGRALKPGGVLYATYGPLWYAAQGDHFSGWDGTRSAYNHLLLSPDEYAAYVHAPARNVQRVQGGARYMELDLFSRLRSGDYLQAFEQAGFVREWLAVELSGVGLRFRRTYPQRWRELRARYPQLLEEDFLIKGHWVLLRKRGAAQ